jgi:hypothetical protein
VFEKWKPQLRPTSHNITGLWVLAPKIISDKFAETEKGTNTAGIIVSLFTVLILWIGINFRVFGFIRHIFVLQTTSIVAAVLMISGRLFVLKSKMNTTHLFWFNKSFNLLLLYGLLIGFGCFPILFVKYRYKSRWQLQR